MIVTIIASVLVATSAFAAKPEPEEIPGCENVAKACEAAGFQPGEHKKTGKGLWVDCVRKIAKGETVEGVSVSQDEAKVCRDAHKAERKARKEAKKK